MRKRNALCAAAAVSVGAIAVGHGEKGGLAPTPVGESGFSSENVALRSRVSLQDFGSTQGNDCWGYVAPSGREYALMGLTDKTAVVEITDPLNPEIVSEVPHPLSVWSDIKVFGSHAYVVSETVGTGLQVVDLSNVDAGAATHVATMTTGGFSTAHNMAVNEASGFLYTVGSNAPSNGLVVWDLSNPASPALVGSYTGGGYVHDAHVVTMTGGPWAGREIAFLFIEDRGIDIVDVTDKSAMTRLAARTYPGVAYSHQGWFDASTNLLYQNDELDETIFGVTTSTRVWDVSDLTNPALVNIVTTGLDSSDHNNYTHEGFIYQANYRSGLRIFDARTDPVNPTQVGWFDTFSADDSAAFNGAWSVYPFFPSGNVIISDIEGGLFVVDPTFARSGGAPLAFDFPDGLPATTAGEPVRVRITGVNGASLAPGTAALRVVDGEAVVTIPLVALGADLFEGTLPARACGDEIAFWFEAASDTGLTVPSPLSAPLEAYFATAGPPATTPFADTFDANQGWTAGGAGDTATSGQWVRADPVGTIAQPEDDSDDPGLLCFITGNASPGAAAGTADVDAGVTTLLSPRLDASGASVATIRCRLWWSNDLGAAPGLDSMLVEVSNDDGATWTLLEDVLVSTNAWAARSWRIDGLLALTSEMRVRFVARDLGAGSLIEAGVDDFRLETQSCVGGADLNADGLVNGADLGLLLGQWGGPGSADLNGSGTVDGADLGLLLGAWG